ncbi:MAG: YccF domain-containing protein [Mycobacterium sp.]|nr:YccF domain-containing protein [Mycobacterium sp.]
MRIALNIIWLVLAGFWLFVAYVIAGIINCIFIITIPFGIQSFKLAGYALWPFGRMVVHRPDRDVALGCVGNVLWFILGGLWLALGHLLTGILLCLTIIGLPLGFANFKMAGLALAPFGKVVVPVGSVPPGTTHVVSVPVPRA